MIKLYWCPRTRASRALWLLEEAGVEYERVLIDVRNPADRQNTEFLAASPMCKVPALVDGEARLADSTAISLYIADRYPESGLAPAIGDAKRAEYCFWMVFAPGYMEPAMAEKFAGWESNRGVHGWGDFNSMIARLEQGLEGREWILGDKFSAADVMIGSSVYFMRVFGAMPDSAILNAYADRCIARPAYAKALAADAEAAES
ncbi:MAG: glutathione S-transferase family protein [Parvularculaceae bacterium]